MVPHIEREDIGCLTLFQAFLEACEHGDVSEAKSLAEIDPGVFNQQWGDGSGLMDALHNKSYSIVWWLLSQPQLDTSVQNRHGMTALHEAC